MTDEELDRATYGLRDPRLYGRRAERERIMSTWTIREPSWEHLAGQTGNRHERRKAAAAARRQEKT